MVESAGLVIIHDNKVLLAHPTKRKLSVGTFTIPKGKLEVGETHLEAAIRETREEVGIDIDVNLIDKTPHTIEYKNINGKCFKKLTYFVVYLKEKIEVTDDMLMKEEVDYADYFDIDNSRFRLFWRFEEILNFIQ